MSSKSRKRKLAPLRKKLKVERSSKLQNLSRKGLRIDTNDGENLDEDEEAYWERIEKDAEKKGRSSPNNKAPRNEDEEEEDSGDIEDEIGDSSDSSGSDDEGINLTDKVEHISEQFTFEFNDMRPAFTEGICTLLKAKFIANPTEAYEIACKITAQTVVGTAIVCEGENDVFAFATILPLSKHPEGPVYGALQILAKNLTTYKDDSNSSSSSSSGSNKGSDNEKRADQLLECLTGLKEKSTGLLLHRRFANCPIELIGPLHGNLQVCELAVGLQMYGHCSIPLTISFYFCRLI